MKARLFILTAILTLRSLFAFCQDGPPEFHNGLDLFKTDKRAAKGDFLIAIKKDSLFHATYHFLGLVYLDEKKPDSAIWCFKKAVTLNKEKISIPKDASYTRLISSYELKQDFDNAYATAITAIKEYPDNRYLESSLREVCLWSFYVKHNGLDPSYMWGDLKDEYQVKAIDEEYLIFRKIKVNDEYLDMKKQSLVEKDGASYDVFDCQLSDSKKAVKVYFKINWDMSKDFGGKVAPTQPVIDDVKMPACERVGAMLIADRKTNVKAAVKKISQ